MSEVVGTEVRGHRNMSEVAGTEVTGTIKSVGKIEYRLKKQTYQVFSH
jgi:hypothetical protein